MERTEPLPNCCLRVPTPCVARQLLLDYVLACQASARAAAPIDATVKKILLKFSLFVYSNVTRARDLQAL